MAPSFWAAWTCSVLCLAAQAPDEAGPPAPPAAGAVAPAGDAAPSDAERVARLQRSIDADQSYLQSLNHKLTDPNSEFARSDAYFKKIDGDLSETRQKIKLLKEQGKADEAAALEGGLKPQEDRWQEAKKRFDYLIEERKTLQLTAKELTTKIQNDRQALAALTGGPPPGTLHIARDKAPKPAAKAPDKPLPTSPAVALTDAVKASAAGQDGAAVAKPVNQELARAEADARGKEEEAREASAEAQSITARIDNLKKNIELEKKLLESARKKADQAEALKVARQQEFQAKAAAKAPEAELKKLGESVQWAQKASDDARAESRTTNDRLNVLQEELNGLQAEQIRAMEKADEKKRAAADAEKRVADLQNPFHPENLWHWALTHGPKLLMIVLGMLVLRRVARVFCQRIVQFMTRGGGKRGTWKDRENRAETLVSVFWNASSMLVLGGGSLMALDEVGIPIVPLMGGAAVMGLAVAFGAQNLIKDYFSGFMVLLEDQYGINDVVRIGNIAGQVEGITLRMTVLRDLEGVVHFVPHGTITTVSNMTHGWSRALFDISVSYNEDLDHVIRVLLQLGRELRQDPAYAPLILDDPEMLGVDDLGASAVVIRFFVKTQPQQQWAVKREMLRRIKKRFDDLRIEIPFPHQTVYHRYDSAGQDAAPADAKEAA
ncbi:MAG TPA: mechanosensitive ion channel domain-containing protein [Gemmataceae bacterium]|jgi:small conductance mechanosensitive channel|nr:mechanosensitive ion channel domain-containing protein [Gemmataceae bacterium]